MKLRNSERQPDLAALVVPTVLAAVLVLWGLGRAPLWRDEVASVTIADRGTGSMLRVITGHEANMALYDVVLHLWSRLGHQEWLLRLPSAVFAIATVPVAALVARRCAGPRAGWVAGTFVALSTFVVSLGQQARGYTLLMLLATGSALLLLRAVQGGRRRDWIGWALTLAALPWAHLLGALVVVAQLASLLVLPPERRPLHTLAACVGGAAVACLPLALLVHNGDHNRTSWVPAFGRDAIRGVAESLAGGKLVLALLVLATVLVAWRLVVILRAEGRSEAAWLLALPLTWVVVPPVLLGAISTLQSTWVDRYLIGLIPGFGVLAGSAVAALRLRFGPWAAAGLAALLLVAVVRATALAPHPAPAQEDLRGAAAIVAARGTQGDQVLYTPAFARPGFEYYLQRAGRKPPADLALAESARDRGDLFAREVSAAELATRLRGTTGRVWILGYGSVTWHPTPEVAAAVAPAILRERFDRLSLWRLGEIRVQLFAPRA